MVAVGVQRMDATGDGAAVVRVSSWMDVKTTSGLEPVELTCYPGSDARGDSTADAQREWIGSFGPLGFVWLYSVLYENQKI